MRNNDIILLFLQFGVINLQQHHVCNFGEIEFVCRLLRGFRNGKAASISLVARPLCGYKQYPESFKGRNKGVRPVAEQWRHTWLPRGGCVARATVRNNYFELRFDFSRSAYLVGM